MRRVLAVDSIDTGANRLSSVSDISVSDDEVPRCRHAGGTISVREVLYRLLVYLLACHPLSPSRDSSLNGRHVHGGLVTHYDMSCVQEAQAGPWRPCPAQRRGYIIASLSWCCYLVVVTPLCSVGQLYLTSDTQFLCRIHPHPPIKFPGENALGGFSRVCGCMVDHRSGPLLPGIS